MHEAYQVSSLLKLTTQVECISAYGDNLLVGTRQGHLYMYSVIRNEDKCDVQLMRYNKSFSKKPIQQLDVIPEHHLLISLTDNIVQVHDINASNFTTLQQIPKTRGATFFTLNIEETKSLTGGTGIVVRMAVAVKRKIQLYYLKNNQFLDLREEDINLNEVPKTMVWCQEAICVGYRGEYALLDLDGKKTDLFPTSSSRSAEPCIVRVSDTIFALCRDSQTVLVNVQGETEGTKALRWSDVPLTLAWDEPYALGVLNDCIEVMTMEPGGLVQTISDLSKVRFITKCNQGRLYAASISQVWCLQSIDIAKQRKVLLDTKQFQLALKLTEVSNESEEEKAEKTHQIHTILAYDLFANKRFHDSMKEFLKLGTDPYEVIRLFPDLLPQQQQQQQLQQSVNENAVEFGKDLTEKEHETGILALIDYLTEMRFKLHKSESEATVNARGNLNSTTPSGSKSTNQLLQIIDTTLLKCYLQTNDAMVAPLLRRNHCHLGETEKILKKHNKHNELIILYQTKGQHRKALELLKAEHKIDRTVSYLQHLGTENMGLIVEFADWVLSESPEEGLKIFTEDLAEIEALPRARVLDFLLKSHTPLAIPYLEHVIHVWKDTNPLFHNAIIHQYREQVLLGAEPIKRKLLKFLDESVYYTEENILNNFPTDDLLEERAIILGKLGRHEQVIAIYVRALGDIDKALNYCHKVHQANNGDGKKCSDSEKVYVALIKLILDPNSAYLPGINTLSPKTSEPNLELALQLLEEHADKVDALEALTILPDSVAVARISKFLLVALHKVTQDRRKVELLKGLLYAEHLQCQEMKLALQSQHVLVTEMNVCPVCKKRFGNQSALVRYPNGDVVHFSCQEKK